MQTIRPSDVLSEAALLEQSAEEHIELAHAMLKKARYLRGENPVCRSEAELDRAIVEEISDCVAADNELPYTYRCRWDIVSAKTVRWQERLRRMRQEEKSMDDD